MAIFTLQQGCSQIGITEGQSNVEFRLFNNDFTTPFFEGTLNGEGNMILDSADLGLGAGIQLTGVWLMETAGESHAIVAPCDIVCCLAKKMDAYVDKSCRCEECDKDLEEMYKIFLLLHTAQISASLLNNIEIIAAKKKYDKAIELCKLGTCKCNC